MPISDDDYECNDCGFVGGCQYETETNDSEFWGGSASETVMIDLCCAECGSEEIDEYKNYRFRTAEDLEELGY